MSEQTPSNPAGNDRAAGGRFAPGNKAGKGNPNNARAQKIRNALLAAATSDDVKAIVGKLIEGAKTGDLQFIKEFFDRTIGKPVPADLMEELENLDRKIEVIRIRAVDRSGTNGADL